MREHDALRIPGASRGVLDERDVVPAERHRLRRAVLLQQLVHGDDAKRPAHARLEEPRHAPRLGHGDEDARFGVGEDARMPPHVILDLGQVRRRIDRHRDAAGPEHPQVGRKILGAGGQHDRHAAPSFESLALQRAGDAVGLPQQVPVRDARFMAIVEMDDLHAVRMRTRMPVQHLDERCRAVGRGLRRLGPARGNGARPGFGGFSRRRAKRREQVAHADGLAQRPLGQAHAERPLEMHGKLDAAQAVEAEVALQAAVQGDGANAGHARVQPRKELPDGVEHGGGCRLRDGATLLRKSPCPSARLARAGYGKRVRQPAFNVPPRRIRTLSQVNGPALFSGA